MMLQTGLDCLLQDRELRRPLKGRRIGLLAHPASVTHNLQHALNALSDLPEIKLSSAFGPQHGILGDKQDNMVESADYIDPHHGIPMFSLYGSTRRLNQTMLDSFDVLLVDLQDLGCRIYTFLTTLCYLLEDCAAAGKSVWILDRPNPAGRVVEGLCLRDGWQSFVGVDTLPMRHGMTLGEVARWYAAKHRLDLDMRVLAMKNWKLDSEHGHGWPNERAWVNPSPNAATLNMARSYAGTVLLEGTTLSEGRGTTRPLETFAAPDLNAGEIKATMLRLVKDTPHWLAGCLIRECAFEPTFHKHQGKLCHGLFIHTDSQANYRHSEFKPFRLIAAAFKAVRTVQADYPLWRDFAYEYEFNKLAIDVINGSPLLREWVDNANSVCADLEKLCAEDEQKWLQERKPFLLY